MSLYLMDIDDELDSDGELRVLCNCIDAGEEDFWIRFQDLEKMAEAFGYKLVKESS